MAPAIKPSMFRCLKARRHHHVLAGVAVRRTCRCRQLGHVTILDKHRALYGRRGTETDRPASPLGVPLFRLSMHRLLTQMYHKLSPDRQSNSKTIFVCLTVPNLDSDDSPQNPQVIQIPGTGFL